MRALLLLTVIAFALPAHAWDKRGHAIVCQTAAYLAAKEPKGDFLKNHSFDLGYYCNVPDLVWKKPETYALEANNHFMDMEIFERGLKDSKVESPFAMDRLAFNAAFPSIDDKAGRAWWRVRELNDALAQITKKLTSTDLTKEARHAAQADWLVHAGVIGHYIGDLSQPLHVTENYDGQMSEQKGIHAYFEKNVVDEAYFGKGDTLEGEVMRAAEKLAAKTPLAKKDMLGLLQALSADSNKALSAVLKSDKKVGREKTAQAVKEYRQQLVARMAMGSVYLAEIYKRQLGWDYNGDRFYNFVTAPAFIAPPQAKASPTPAP